MDRPSEKDPWTGIPWEFKEFVLPDLNLKPTALALHGSGIFDIGCDLTDLMRIRNCLAARISGFLVAFV